VCSTAWAAGMLLEVASVTVVMMHYSTAKSIYKTPFEETNPSVI